jgi:hypothetical protein
MERTFSIEHLKRLTFISNKNQFKSDFRENVKKQLVSGYSICQEKLGTCMKPAERFMKMFKMGVELVQEDFNILDLINQIQFLSYFFYKFVDRNFCFNLFGNFASDVKILHSSSKDQPK